jgi:hypothetical protein
LENQKDCEVKMTQQKSIIKSQPKRLTDGQEKLYRLILISTKKEQQIQYIDVMKIYKTSVMKTKELEWWCPHPIDGEPGWRSRPYDNYEMRMKCISWLMYSLGRLIVKGYVTVLPKIELKELQEIKKQEIP